MICCLPTAQPDPDTRILKGGTKVDPRDVLIDGEPLDFPDPLHLLLHKPGMHGVHGCGTTSGPHACLVAFVAVGIVCSTNPNEGPLVYDLLPPEFGCRRPPLSLVRRFASSLWCCCGGSPTAPVCVCARCRQEGWTKWHLDWCCYPRMVGTWRVELLRVWAQALSLACLCQAH